MTPERWQRVKALFEAARTAPQLERERLLSEAEDADTAAHVRELLEAYDHANDFLEEPALATSADVMEEQIVSPMVGARLGAYRITRQVGEGGMGVVYEAARDDGQFEQRVAIKILRSWKLSGMDISRFRAERQILARLDHPNIARLLDGGSTADGLPYYAMEFVEGELLDNFCRGRPVTERLELFRKICDAVEYAHRRGIIHRDLKPANIIVTRSGIPKLLDFGIAKVLEGPGARIRTLTLNRAVTPYYASPEQLKGEPLTPTSDVYSLGVILYELLTGAHPHRTTSDAIHVVAAAICEQDPEPPGRRVETKTWTKDLDAVVMKAMNRNPAGRYFSAAELSDEIARYLEHQPVLARVEARHWTGRRVKQRWWMAAAALAVLAAAAVIYFVARPKPIDSLAVVPFVNVGGDPNAEYLSDGITENLINNLSQLPKLRVVPRSVVFNYKGREKDPRDIGRDLHVRAILTGRVVRRGGSLNVQTELVDVKEVSQLWGQQYERKFTEILAVQEDIAKQVSEKLHLRPSGAQQKQLAKRYTENTEAYQLYLQGRYYWNRRTEELLKKANDYFQQAINKDPRYGLAYAALAQSYALFGFYEVNSPADSCPKAKAAASRALEIDENLVDAHAALGWIKMSCDWDWSGSGQEFQRALAINPNDATTRNWHGAYLEAIGRLQDTLAEARRAKDDEPLNLINNASLGRVLHFAGRDEEAIEQLRKTIEIDPGFIESHLYLGWVYEGKGLFTEAIAEFQQAVTLSGGHPRYLSALAHTYAVSGQTKLAEGSLAELKAQQKQRYISPYEIAVVYAGLKQTDEAFRYLELAYQDRSWWLVRFRIDPRFDGIRRDPRYQDLLRRMYLAS